MNTAQVANTNNQLKNNTAYTPKSFLSYHYTIALPQFIRSRPKKLAEEFKFLNIAGLTLHLFSPFRRLTSGKKTSAFDRFSFDLISRIIGAIVRILLIFPGLFIFLLFAFAYVWEIIFYLVPIFSLSNYLKYKHNTFFDSDLQDSQKFLKKLKGSKFFQSLSLFFEDDLVKLLESFPPANTLGINPANSLSQMLVLISQNWVEFKSYLESKSIEAQEFKTLTDYLDTFYLNPVTSAFAPIGYELIYGYTNTLDLFGHEITNQQMVNPYFNKNLVGKLENILTKPNANNALLVGNIGVGKHSSIENLASAIDHRQLPKLNDKRIIVLDTIALVASSNNLIDIKSQFEKLLFEAKKAGNIILVIYAIDKITSSL